MSECRVHPHNGLCIDCGGSPRHDTGTCGDEKKEKEILIKSWVKRGVMLVNTTDGLDWDDPDNVYNQIISQGGRPEDYDIEHPLYEKYKDLSRNELIEALAEVEKIMDSLAFNGII